MAEATQPTRQTRHIDIRNFAIQSWVEEDKIVLLEINTSLNPADILTKQVPRLPFSLHYDNLSGRSHLAKINSKTYRPP